MKYKFVYGIFYFSEFGQAMQPTKGNTLAEAKQRFKKKNPKKKIADTTKRITKDHPHFYRFSYSAI